MADTLDGLKIKAYDLAEQMGKKQEEWNALQAELNKVNAQIKEMTGGNRPQANSSK
jgi:hypothetical protein